MKKKPSVEEMQFERKEENYEMEELRMQNKTTTIMRMKFFRILAAIINIKMSRICKQPMRP